MSAEERRHEDAPKKIDERVISEERLSWVRTLGSEWSYALAQELARAADQRPEVPSGAALESDATRDTLLSAIKDTETARSMSGLMPADGLRPHGPACAESPKTLFAVAGAEVEPSAVVVQQAPAARLTRTFMVQTSPLAASMPVILPTATPLRHPAPTEPDSILEKDKTRYRLLRAISEGSHLVGEIPAGNPLIRHLVQTSPHAASVPLMPLAAAASRHPDPPEPDSIVEENETRDRLLLAISATEIAGRLGAEIAASNPQFRKLVQTSPQAASTPLMPAPTAPPHRRVSATTSMIEETIFAAIPQIPSPTQPVAAAVSAPEVTAPSLLTPAQDASQWATLLVECNREINRLGAKLASTTKRMGRASWQLSVRFQNRVLARAALTVESTSRITTQLSFRSRNWMETNAAPAMGRLGRSVWQLSIQFKSWVVARAALTVKRTSRATTQLSIQFKSRVFARATPTVESTDIAGSQLSTGLDDRAPAAPSAPGMESKSQSRPQSPTRFKRWFGPRRSSRLAKPPVVAYCWTADTPHSVKIADISSGGVRLLTDVRWPRGGVLSMTLQRTDRTNDMPESWIVIDFIVIRSCKDGVAGAFIPSTHRLSRFIPSRAENCADDKTLKSFVRHLAVPGRHRAVPLPE